MYNYTAFLTPQTHTHACMHTHLHAHMHTRARTHTHTHNTHTYIYSKYQTSTGLTLSCTCRKLVCGRPSHSTGSRAGWFRWCRWQRAVAPHSGEGEVGIEPRLPGWEGVGNWNWNRIRSHSGLSCAGQVNPASGEKEKKGKKRGGGSVINWVMTFCCCCPFYFFSLSNLNWACFISMGFW